MSGAPYSIINIFEADDEDDLKLVQIAFGDGEWHDVPESHQALDSTLLVLWSTKGVEKIAVQYEERVIEFNLRGIVLRDGSFHPVERETDEEAA